MCPAVINDVRRLPLRSTALRGARSSPRTRCTFRGSQRHCTALVKVHYAELESQVSATVHCLSWRFTALAAPWTFSVVLAMLTVHNVAPRIFGFLHTFGLLHGAERNLRTLSSIPCSPRALPGARRLV